MCLCHRRRINTEEKSKVVAAIWGAQIASVCCHASYLGLWHKCDKDDSRKRMNSFYYSNRPGASHPILQIFLVQFFLFFNSTLCKIASTARNWINSVPQAEATTFAFSSVLILLLWSVPLWLTRIKARRSTQLNLTGISPKCWLLYPHWYKYSSKCWLLYPHWYSSKCWLLYPHWYFPKR